MRPFIPEPLIYSIIIAIIPLMLVYLVDKYSYFFEPRPDDSGDSEFVKYCRDPWRHMRDKETLILAIILISPLYFTANVYNYHKTLCKIKKEQISPVKATARAERKMPYGIRIYLQDAAHSTYQFDLEDTSLNKEFIEKVNSGYTVSKLRNSTDILLTNGNDSIFYNLYY